MKRTRRFPSRRAVILVLTLWMVLVLALLAHSLAFEMIVEMQLSSAHRDLFLAEQMARIGIARAVADLKNDRLLTDQDQAVWNQQFDALGDVWAGGSVSPRVFSVAAPGERTPLGEYELLVIDEESKFPLNIMTPEWRDAMKYLLVELGVAETQATYIANALWDWKDPDNAPIGGQGENEIAFYSKIQSEHFETGEDPRALYPKNGPFETVEEILLVPGITPELFYGYDPETESEPGFFPPSIEENVRPGLRDLLTVRATRGNINTLRYECLVGIFAAASGDLSMGRTYAGNILAHRWQNRRSDIKNTHAFRKKEQLGLVEGISSGLMAKAEKAVPLTTESEFFTIYCEARYGREVARARNTRTWGRSPRPLPTARVVAACQRGLVPLSLSGRQAWNLPGHKAREATTPQGVFITTFFMPAVYFLDWNGF